MGDFTILPAGDAALLVTLGSSIDEPTNRRVHALAHALARSNLAGVGGGVPGYATLLVHFDPLVCARDALAAHIDSLLTSDLVLDAPETRLVSIPVRYGGQDGPDLAFVAQNAGLSELEVIKLHSQPVYTVYMMGFTPGFPYLGGMDVRLSAPRLATPRNRIPAGSVGIAGEQTGIYPVDSPGGWRIIGRTSLKLFNLDAEHPFYLTPGDHLRFVPEEELPDGAGGA
jgi:KipI family sensor histidine kinase inhibitor